MYQLDWNSLLVILILLSIVNLDHHAFTLTTLTTSSSTMMTTSRNQRLHRNIRIVRTSRNRHHPTEAVSWKIGVSKEEHYLSEGQRTSPDQDNSRAAVPATTMYMTISDSSSSSSSKSSSDLQSQRVHNVNFVSPLLDYGYPPAARDLELQQMLQQREGNDLYEDETAVKPILLYLPGFDGTYICPFIQFPELGTEFDVWCMTMGMDDRSTYPELKASVLDFLKNRLSCVGSGNDHQSQEAVSSSASDTTGNSTKLTNDKRAFPNVGGGFFAGWFGGNGSTKTGSTSGSKGIRRPVYLAGESFGGILASDVALTLLKENRINSLPMTDGNNGIVNLQGLVLINPATCYDRSQLAAKGPQVASMPNAVYLFGLFTQLVPLFTDEYSAEQLLLILQAKALPSVIDNPVREAYMGRVAISLPKRLEFMPPSTLSWRLGEWLQAGCTALRGASFKEYPKFRSLIVVGERDKTLPSIAEAERLATKVMLPSQTQIHVVEGAGHASTCGSRLDLAAVMRKRFPELQKRENEKRTQMRKAKTKENDSERTTSPEGGNTANSTADINSKRTAMKLEAQQGSGPYFGMEHRYDGADIGLNPILYWSKDNYRKVQKTTEQCQVLLPGTAGLTSYTKVNYKVSNHS